MTRRKRLRLPFVRHPRDASQEFDDASYDGGISGGSYLRHVVLAVVILTILAGVVRCVT
ncbi:hypothetical protein KR767_03535 [Luteibacter anthropi]|uniref:Uncharacterized protein n=1 Tax=Luteibacter anthropi TaxID=564369 RepID=A0A7X5ZKA8_9GAMM|nr:hypothetical protein [Luteibacter anthropi]NII08827.1 hypothetical protein [Luteibacter anthropi]URX63155.1 hypothetical protein KR767_03535 [Luteibacter anthropi]